MIKVFYEMFQPNDIKYLFLDEIQSVSDWEIWVRRVYDSKKFRIYITGSSSKLLSREISTRLRGRSIEFAVLPFNFQEFLLAKGYRVKDLEILSYLEERGRILGFLKEYLIYGGYPKVVLTRDEKIKEKILISYYNAIFYKDLVERYKFGADILDIFLKHCVSSFSKYLSISKIYNYIKSLGFKTSKSTLTRFLRAAKEVFFLFPLEIFSYTIKDRRQYPKKIYVVDNGIVNALYSENRERIGKFMENCVRIELARRNTEVFYWKEYGKAEGKEVDFVIKEGLKIKQLIQVCYNISDIETKEREIKALIKASESLKCKNLLVITWDYESEEEFKGKKIKFLPLWKWLLSK